MRRALLCVVAMSVFAVLAQPSFAAETKVLKIGSVDSLTGWMAAGEQPTNDGAKLAVDWVNEKGGITVKGVKYQLELITEDAKSSPEGMAAACTKLVEKDKVKFVIGGVNPVMNIAASSVTEPAGVFRLSNYTCANPEEFDPKFSLTFFLNSTVQGMRPMLTYLKEAYPQVKALALSQPGDGGGKYRLKHFEPIANELGFSVVYNAEWPGETIDFTPFIKKTLAANPDAYVFTDGWAYHAGAQVKALHGLGYQGPIISTDSEIITEVLAITGPDMIDGYAVASWEMFSPDMKPVMKEDFLPRVIKSGNTNAWQVWGWNNIWVLTQAIESAQSLDPAKVAENLRSVKTLETLFGPATIGGEKTFGIKCVVCAPQAVFTAKNGRPVFVKWVPTTTP